jgi:threonylcarbamoyladenosine tRNA methylthiotransferase CDKAL1
MQVFIRSFGCSTNTSDSEVLAGCLEAAGYTIVNEESDAKVVIYNSCAVKGPTENRIIDALKKVPKDKKIIVTGCLPLISFERLSREVRFDAVAGPALGKDIVELVKQVSQGKKIVRLNSPFSKPQLDLPRLKKNPFISIIPVNYGCLGSCSYCCVVHARGNLRSYSIEEIVERIRMDFSKGTREFWITSQDTSCYGRDIGKNIVDLLREVISIKGKFLIRLGMMTPNGIEPILEELIKIYKSKKIFKFIHLPIQSGDDEVLRKMRRFYTVQDFKETIATFRTSIPRLTLSTDIICGFPGETTNAFKHSLKLIREVKPDIVNVSKFFARPKTEAWNMRNEAIEKSEIKRRSSQMAMIAKEIALKRNKLWIGWRGKITIDEKGKVQDSWIGRNTSYKPVTVKSTDELLGKTLNVKISKAFSTYLFGIIQ